MTCISPIAPARETVGRPFVVARPPLSIRITSRIHRSGTPKRRDASAISGCQRSTAGAAALAVLAARAGRW
jgi:hypothetical protein